MNIRNQPRPRPADSPYTQEQWDALEATPYWEYYSNIKSGFIDESYKHKRACDGDVIGRTCRGCAGCAVLNRVTEFADMTLRVWSPGLVSEAFGVRVISTGAWDFYNPNRRRANGGPVSA